MLATAALDHCCLPSIYCFLPLCFSPVTWQIRQIIKKDDDDNNSNNHNSCLISHLQRVCQRMQRFARVIALSHKESRQNQGCCWFFK